MEFFDTHCHLDFKDFDEDRAAVVKRAAETGLVGIANIGTTLAASRRCIRLAREYPLLHPAVGIHPHYCGTHSESDLDEIAQLAKDDNVVAIGETGLDFCRKNIPGELQEKFLLRHLEIAVENNKPVVLHSRASGGALMDIIERFMQAGSGKNLRGTFHCFTEPRDVLTRALKAGLKIGISGIVTFPKGGNVRELVKFIPDDHLLLDSDCPFLAPEPKRGKRNEPAWVVHIAQKLADLRGVSLADMARITTRNAKELFSLDGIEEAGKIAYAIRDSLYLALTNDCLNNCTFCARNRAWRVKGHDIRLDHDPSADEVLAAMGDTSAYKEIVFCGFGEPTMRLEVLKTVAAEVHRRGQKVRLNTNGLGSLYHGRNIVPELAGLIDTCSISLNTADPEQYNELCQPQVGGDAFAALCGFIRESARLLPATVCTVVEMPGIEVAAAERLAGELGAEFRLRSYVDVG